MISIKGRLAQLARALLSHGRGRGFESPIAHQMIQQGHFGQLRLEFQTVLFIFPLQTFLLLLSV